MPKGKGHDVICPGCRESYHETTKSYNPNRDANAGMLELRAIYKSYGWDEPVRDPTAGYGILICPDCEAPLAPSGRLEVRAQREKIQIDATEVGDLDAIAVGSESKLPTGKESDLVSTEASSDKPSAPFSMESVVKAAEKAEKKEFVCPDCGRDFEKNAHLGSHMRVHK